MNHVNPIWLELNQLASLNQQGGLWTIENKKSSAPGNDISVSPQVKESGFRHPVNFSEILDLSFEMRNTNQGIRNLATDWNPES